MTGQDDRQKMMGHIEVACRDEARLKPACEIAGLEVANESSFSRVLRAAGQSRHRGRARAPRPSKAPTTHVARAPGEVWCWDMT